MITVRNISIVACSNWAITQHYSTQHSAAFCVLCALCALSVHVRMIHAEVSLLSG